MILKLYLSLSLKNSFVLVLFLTFLFSMVVFEFNPVTIKIRKYHLKNMFNSKYTNIEK